MLVKPGRTTLLPIALTIVATAALVSVAAQDQDPTDHTLAANFGLLAPARCPGARDEAACRVARPKEWTAEERRVIGETVTRLSTHALVRGIIVAARENGYGGLHRFATDTRSDPLRGQVPKLSPGFVLYGSKIIGVTDLFFDSAEVVDAAGGYRVGDAVLLHELIHAFDDRRWSADPAFRTAAGWAVRNGRWLYVNPVEYSAYNGVVAETLTLYARGEHAKAWARSRQFARGMVVPLPSIQSLATPAETFADVLAHLILDAQARTYLSSDLVTWFERHIFPLLNEHARGF